MAWRFHGRAETSSEDPSPWATCQRCGCLTNLHRLSKQKQWGGASLIDLNLLVCDKCLDKPSSFLRSLTLPPDPPFIVNPRPEPYFADQTDFRVTEDGQQRLTEDGQTRITEENTLSIPDSNN